LRILPGGLRVFFASFAVKEMIRTCPRCGDFYADDSLLFCLADGTPLADVVPRGDSWAEGSRVVEEKERAARERSRRVMRRRVMLMTTTLLVTTLAVYVVAVHTYVIISPKPDAPVVAAALTPTPKPSETPWQTPTPDTASLPFVYVTPTPTPSPSPTKTPDEKCTTKDGQRLKGEIVAGHAADWRHDIEKERDAVVKENVPKGSRATGVEVSGGEASLGEVTYEATFDESCTSASITATYVWTVTWEVFFNGRRKPESKPVSGSKTFACEKSGGAWRCR
jgi:hypothetical protein